MDHPPAHRRPPTRSPLRRALVGTALGLHSAAAACAPAEPGEAPAWTVGDSAGVPIVENLRPAVAAGSWALTPEPLLVLGRGDTVHFGRPADVRLLPDGGLLVADGGSGGWQIAFVFGPDGDAVADCGGAGDGRGALGRLGWAAPWPGDSIVAYDAADHTLAVFDLFDGFGRGCRVVREVALPGAAPSAPGEEEARAAGPGGRGADGLLPDGSVLAWVAGDPAPSNASATAGGPEPEAAGPGPGADRTRRRLELRVDPDGAVVDTLASFDLAETWWRGRPGRLPPFPATSSLVPAVGGFAYAPGRPFEVRLHDGEGRLARIARRAWTPDTLTVADREAFVTWFAGRSLVGPEPPPRAERERLLRELPWPPSRPAVSGLVAAADGGLWLEGWRWFGDEMPPDPEPTTWSVFSPSGRWVADVVVPAGFLLTDVRDGRVAGVHVDGDGRRHVRVYGLVRRGDGGQAPGGSR